MVPAADESPVRRKRGEKRRKEERRAAADGHCAGSGSGKYLRGGMGV